MARGSDQAVILSLCKRLSLVPKSFSGEVEKCDLKSMCTSILQASQAGAPLLGNDEALKWISFANDFAADSGSPDGALTSLNNELVTKSVLLGGGLKLSEVDTIVFSAIHQSVIGLPKVERQKLSHVLRWMDYVQSKEDLADLFERLSIEKAQLEPPVKKVPAKVEANPGKEAKATKADSEGNNASKGPKTSDVPDSNSKKGGDSTIQQKAKGDKKVADQKKAPEKAATAKDAEVPVSLLNMQVGLIHKASKHPSADSLLVEEIDVGEGKLRQVVSGLAKYCNPDELVNRLVVLITNVKPGKLRDVVSEGLVLCASNEDHTKVEPLLPPEGAKPGERISISGHDGKPEDVLNPKKKQLDKITPHLYTDDKGVATFKGIPFMTSAGPCTSSIPKGSIK